MMRTLLCATLLLTLASCQNGPDQRSGPMIPLPDKVQPMPYGQLLERSRALARQATEAFYVDNWTDLEEAARGMEQIAQYLIKAEDVPVKHRDTLKSTSGDLGKLALQLREAAAAKDVKKTTDLLTKIQVLVREMRLSESS